MVALRAIISAVLLVTFSSKAHASRVRVAKHESAAEDVIVANDTMGGPGNRVCKAVHGMLVRYGDKADNLWKMSVECVPIINPIPFTKSIYTYRVLIYSPQGAISFFTYTGRPSVTGNTFQIPIGRPQQVVMSGGVLQVVHRQNSGSLEDLFQPLSGVMDYTQLQWTLAGEILQNRDKEVYHSITLKHSGRKEGFMMEKVGNGCCSFKWDEGADSTYFNEAMTPQAQPAPQLKTCMQACTDNPGCVAASHSTEKTLHIHTGITEHLCWLHIAHPVAAEGAQTFQRQLRFLIKWISEHGGTTPEGPEDLVGTVQAVTTWPEAMTDQMRSQGVNDRHKATWESHTNDCPNQECYAKNFQRRVGSVSELVFDDCFRGWNGVEGVVGGKLLPTAPRSGIAWGSAQK